jgi:hypothetical protein
MILKVYKLVRTYKKGILIALQKQQFSDKLIIELEEILIEYSQSVWFIY